MSFIKKIIFILVGMGIVAFGGAGIREQGSGFANISGFLSLIFGGIILFIFAKMAWRAVGCMVSMVVILVVITFMLYAVGLFSDGMGEVPNKIKNMIGGDVKKEAIEELQIEKKTSEKSTPMDSVIEGVEQEEKNIPPKIARQRSLSPNLASNSEGLSLAGIKKVFNNAVSNSNRGQKLIKANLNPAMLPSIYGSVRVINGDTIQVNDKLVRLFGIDAPESNQSCANKFGSSYHCGKKAAKWLKKWLGGNTIECKVVEQNKQGHIVGICTYGPYDIAAALVNAGWAVSYDQYSTVYKPYENQAQKNMRGLWQGRFYMPWDWRDQQNKKPQIKVLMLKKKKKPTPFSPRF